jgi:hypothetical protein
MTTYIDHTYTSKNLGTDKQRVDIRKPHVEQEDSLRQEDSLPQEAKYALLIVARRESNKTFPKRAQLFQMNHENRGDPMIKYCMKRGVVDVRSFNAKGAKMKHHLRNIPIPKDDLTYAWQITSSVRNGLTMEMFTIGRTGKINRIHSDRIESVPFLGGMNHNTLWINQNEHGNCRSDMNVRYLSLSWKAGETDLQEFVQNNLDVVFPPKGDFDTLALGLINTFPFGSLLENHNCKELVMKRRSVEIFEGRNVMINNETKIVDNKSLGVSIHNRIRVKECSL